MDKRIIFCIIAIIIVLAIAFLSQKAYLKSTENTFVSGIADQAASYLAKGANWALSNTYSKISGEVTKRGEAIQNEVNKEKEKISGNILDTTKNYFSGIVNSIVNPGSSNNCSASQ